jgi:hypothetical protein
MEENVNHNLKRYLISIFAIVTLATLTAQAQNNNDPVSDQKEWNFLVFLNGVNNLDPFGSMNINQMEEVGSNNKMNILVQWGSEADKDVKRLRVEKDNDKNKVTSPILQNLGSSDMGDWRELVNFASWAQTNYPAKHTMIVVWNHGSGWHLLDTSLKINLNSSINISPTDISYDDRTGNVITTEQLGVAMAEISKNLGRKVDIYSSDACLMAMIEVADQMADSVHYFAGSQDLEPGEGWPYSEFLRKWQAQPQLDAAGISKLLSKEFVAAYSGGIYGHSSVTFSAFDMKALPKYKAAFAKVSRELAGLKNSELKRIKAMATETKYFFYDEYRDMQDFLSKIENMGYLSNSSINDLKSAHGDLVIANDQNQDQSTWGLSIWLPTSASTFNKFWPRYKDLNFNKATDWGIFLLKLNNL